MLKKKTLTVAELKSLFLARFKIEQGKQAKLEARIDQELGNEIQEEKPETIAIKNEFVDFISGALARRLKQNRRTTPLFSFRTFVSFIHSMINEIAKADGNELIAEDRKMLEKFMKAAFENICEMVHVMVPPRNNPYEEYWRWVTIVLDLASERGILPTELLALEGATDEITRRLFTKKQYVALFKWRMKKLTDPDVLKKKTINLLLSTIPIEIDEEERREFEQEFETKMMPQLHETVEKTKAVVNAFFNEEVERIYAVT